jgi:hypothetical protein
MSGIDPDTFITETMPALIREKLPDAEFIDTGLGKRFYVVKLYDGIMFSFIRREYKSTIFPSIYEFDFSFTQDGMCFHESYINETLALAGLDEFLTTKPKLPTWVFAELALKMGPRGYTIDLTSRILGTFTFSVKHRHGALSRNLIVHYFMGKWCIEISKTLDVGVDALNVGSIMSALQDTATTLQGRVSGDIDTCHVLNRLTTLFVQ